MAWIGKCINSRHHEPCEFSKEYYVGDGRAKGVDARVCPGLAMPLATSLLEKLSTGCNLPHSWIMSLTMHIVALCDMYMEVKMVPMDAIWLFSVLM